jgi:hypothetical protein
MSGILKGNFHEKLTQTIFGKVAKSKMAPEIADPSFILQAVKAYSDI